MREVTHYLIECGDRRPTRLFEAGCFHHVFTAAAGAYRAGVVLRDASAAAAFAPDEQVVALFSGDAQDAADGDGFLGHGIRVTLDLAGGSFTLHASLSGLPCLYGYAVGSTRVYASSVALIAAYLDGRLEFDEEGVLDLALVGHPVGGRTLFRNVSLVGAGTRLVHDAGRTREEVWSPPAEPRHDDQDAYLAEVAAATAAAVGRMDLDGAFLSLTAGLDTRAILALLAAHGRTLPAFTIAGERGTIDSQRAAELSRRCGLEHRVVHLDDAFCAALPGYCEAASVLSGGLASLGQSHELHLYASLSRHFDSRLSGNLGNQVGRSGTEGVGMRGVDLGLLSARLSGKGAAAGHWFDRLEGSVDRTPLRFLVQQENLYASQANHCVGHHHAAQKTPYADRTVLSLKAREPLSRARGHGVLAVRLRDIRHRFLGEARESSFQRRLAERAGGPIAQVPVNWGWRPRGGLALREGLQGCRACLDMATRFTGLDDGACGRVLDRLRIKGYGDFHRSDLIHLPAVHDLLATSLDASGILDGDLFDRPAVTALLATGPADRRGAGEKEFLLDVALAWCTFTSRERLLAALRVDRPAGTSRSMAGDGHG